MAESMEFTWTITTKGLLAMLEDAYNHVATPDELVEWLLLTGKRTYTATDMSTGRTFPVSEEVHFQMRRQNEDADLFDDVEPYDQDDE